MAISKYMGIYDYEPSEAAAVLFAILFGLTTIAHGIQLIVTKTWFLVPFFLGGIFEVIGYITRSVSAAQAPNYTILPGTLQTVFILVAPSMLAASVYMELGRIILVTNGERFSLVRPSWITKIFLIGDVVSFVGQAAGAATLENSFSSGERLIKIGLAVQVVFFGLFITTASIFHYRIREHCSNKAIVSTSSWEKHLFVLYVASVLIFIRSIFRLAEYTGGSSSALLQHEYYMIIFDAVLIFISMVIFNLVYPSSIQDGILSHRQVQLRDLVQESSV